MDAAVFDSSRLVDFGEQTIFDGAAVLVSPLIRESGRLVVTNQRIYYQPLHSISGDVVVMTHPLSAVAAIAKRHCSLRPIGMFGACKRALTIAALCMRWAIDHSPLSHPDWMCVCGDHHVDRGSWYMASQFSLTRSFCCD